MLNIYLIQIEKSFLYHCQFLNEKEHFLEKIGNSAYNKFHFFLSSLQPTLNRVIEYKAGFHRVCRKSQIQIKLITLVNH